MRREMMRAKIHRATVTAANLNYTGSITIDSRLMSSADLYEYEKVQVLNVTTGARFETYVIEGRADSGTICLNGAAARLAQPNDVIIVIAYGSFEDHELDGFQPLIVHVDENNRELVGSSA